MSVFGVKLSYSASAGVFLVLAAALSWSTLGLFARAVSTDIPTTLFWHALTGGVCMFVWGVVLRPGIDLRGSVHFLRGAVLIAFLWTAGMFCLISSFFYTTIANVTFIQGFFPLATFMLSVVILREPVCRVALASCAVSIAGVLLIVRGGHGFDAMAGLSLAFLAMLFSAMTTVAVKYYPGADAIRVAYLSAFLGALAVSPWSSYGGLSPYDHAWLAAYGFVNIGLGLGLYLVGVSRIPAVAAALIVILGIPLAPVWVWLLFGETVENETLLGGVLILSAAVTYLAMRGLRRWRVARV